MKAIAAALLCIVLPALALAQAPNVVSTVPVNNTVNVPTSTTTVSLTFDAAVDPASFVMSQDEGPTGGFATNVDSLLDMAVTPDHLTVNLTVKLSAGKPYFVCLYHAKRTGGTALVVPYTFWFTTAASFPATTVSGTVSGGTTGISPAYALVVLNDGPINGPPKFLAGAVADVGGVFTIPYVPDGAAYPIAAKDLNGDGAIDPSLGDAIALGSPFVVSGVNITNVSLTFLSAFQSRYKDAVDSLTAHLGTLPSPRALRRVSGGRIDSTGAAGEWEFYYTGTDRLNSRMVRVELFGVNVSVMDSGSYQWMTQLSPILALPSAAIVDSFLARAERTGGYAYRPVPMNWNGFDARLSIGDIYWGEYWDMIADTSKLYLGMNYWYGIYGQNNQTTYSQRRFLGDITNGNILGITAVKGATDTGVPKTYSLEQNYPNPFNPSTTIGYSLPEKASVTLSVYNMLGQQVATLVNQYQDAGYHQARFDGGGLASGVYFYRLQVGNFVETRKLVLMK